jgi:type VI secretion system protein ImpC
MTYSTAALPSLRWMISVPLTASPSGRIVPLADALEQLALSVSIDLGPALGADGPRPVTVQFARLRAFNRAAVIAGTPLLAGLHGLSERLTPSSRWPTADVLAVVSEFVGKGPLHAEVAAIYAAKPPPAAPAPAPTAAADSALVDELLATAPAPAPTARPAAIIDAIVRSNQPAQPSASEADRTRAARERIAAAVHSAAELALADPAVRAREALWRDLKLLHEQCAHRQGFSASLLDADRDIVAAYLTQIADDDAMARPDVIFLGGAYDELEGLDELAELAADAMVPVVFGVSPATVGKPDLTALAELPVADASPAWTALRADTNTRWLAAVINPAVHVRDGAREVHGAPALTLAAMIAASHRTTGGLASLARAGAFPAPLTSDTTRADEHAPPPTVELALLRTQGRLAAHGLISLGSPRTGESLVVAACPVLHAAADAGSLPAQILTGRIVRFALWVRGQVPPGASATAVQRLFSEAATVSLLPGLTADEASMSATVDAAARQVIITARVHPAIAGAPLEINFGLPLANLG